MLAIIVPAILAQPVTALPTSLIAVALPALVAVIACAVIVLLLARQMRHQRALRTLYLEADGLESDLKECRSRLARAHASMSMGPNEPAAGEVEARHAVDAALRELLAHRLWLRDEAGGANQRDLDAAVSAIGKARGALGTQLRELDSAQRALETAVREKIEDLSQQ
ncbi:MAG: hypothetical protein ACREPK_00930 [Rhodanobacteraceae bacterium]